MLAGPPLDAAAALRIPAIRGLLGGSAATPVWRNELGGLTFEVDAPAGRRFLKWSPADSGIDLRAETERLQWASPYAAVPTVLDSGRDEDGCWLITAALPGASAVSERWLADPASAVRAIGEGLRALHDALPVEACPYSWAVPDRIAIARRRASAGLARPADWHPEHQALSIADAMRRLADAPPVDLPVVCHGDACAPNILIGGDGRWSGLVDLGALGVADRWADLAIATWSTEWNYGPGWERPCWTPTA
jgi:kanamycin kinase